MSPDRPVGTRVLDWIAASRRRWLLIGTVLCALLPPLLSWPELPAMPGEANAAWRQYWREVVKLKVDNPWFDYTRAFPAESNQAKRNFRITVPILAHATGFGIDAVPVVRFTLQALLIVCLLLAAERACGDRVAALAAALAVAGTYVGTSVWMDDWGWFDNCAQAFMLLALALRRPFWVCAAVVAAAFTDERALIAVPLIALFHAWTGDGRRLVWAAVVAIPSYLLARVLIGVAFRIATTSAGIATASMILPNLRVSMLGAWSSLEGGWILVAVACVAAVRAGNRFAALFLAVACIVPVAASVVVIDFSRSASYAFPATLAALALWASQFPKGGVAVDRATLRRWTALAAAVSLLSPNVFIMGRTFIQKNIVTHALSGVFHTGP
jgi:hypothetical protein